MEELLKLAGIFPVLNVLFLKSKLHFIKMSFPVFPLRKIQGFLAVIWKVLLYFIFLLQGKSETTQSFPNMTCNRTLQRRKSGFLASELLCSLTQLFHSCTEMIFYLCFFRQNRILKVMKFYSVINLYFLNSFAS